VKIVKKTYKLEILPNKSQKELLERHFGANRFIYNLALETKKSAYNGNKINVSCYTLNKQLSELKKECIWLKEINSQSLQQTIGNLDKAYTNFFEGRSKFPKFKSKKNKNSFHIPQFVNIFNNKLVIPKFKTGIKINIKKLELLNIINCTIVKETTGKYFACILCDVNHISSNKTGLSVGLDLGIKDFCITSNDVKYENSKYIKKYEKKLKQYQQYLSRKKKGSKNKNKQRLKVARIHEKITNSRNDRLHKISHEIVNKYDIICHEDLNIKGMLKNDKLSKSISDVSWNKFLTYLNYKAEWNDKIIVKIDRWFPSSKTCSSCGYIHKDLTLNIREWTCVECGTVHDRDLNAAKNILKEGLKTYRKELAITLAEMEVTKSVKQETTQSLVEW
jgi:putative transposase